MGVKHVQRKLREEFTLYLTVCEMNPRIGLGTGGYAWFCIFVVSQTTQRQRECNLTMLLAFLTYEKAVGQGMGNRYWLTMNDKVFPPDVIRVVQIVRLDVEVERVEKASEL
jgi:hypothetical protein